MARNTSAAIQMYRGTTEQHATYIGPVGEITVDTTKNTAVVHDGEIAGGHPLAKESLEISLGTVLAGLGFELNGGSGVTLTGDITIDASLSGLVNGLVDSDDNILYLTANNKLGATVSVTYDMFTGEFKLIGNDDTVLAELTIPAATSAVKAVNLVNGKPDADGEAIEGEYHVSLQFADGDGNWGDAIGAIFTTTKDVASAAVAVSAAMAASGVGNVRAWFNGQEATGTVSGTTASLTFADGSTLEFSNVSASGTAVAADVVFTPTVGLVAGTYLCVTWSLYDGTVSDTYVDMSLLGVTVVSADSGNLIEAGSDGGALLTESMLEAAVGSFGCDMISETTGNQLQCDNGKLMVVSDYGTMGD